jgi:hypothetical protein
LIEGKLARTLDRSEWDAKPGRLEEIFVQTLESSGTSLVR